MFPKSIKSLTSKSKKTSENKEKSKGEQSTIKEKISGAARKAKKGLEILSPRNKQLGNEQDLIDAQSNSEIDAIRRLFSEEKKPSEIEQKKAFHDYTTYATLPPSDMLINIQREFHNNPLYQLHHNKISESEGSEETKGLGDDDKSMRMAASEALNGLNARRERLLANTKGNLDTLHISGPEISYYLGTDAIVKGNSPDHQKLRAALALIMEEIKGGEDVPVRQALLCLERAIAKVQREMDAAGDIRADLRLANQMDIANCFSEARNCVAGKLSHKDFTEYFLLNAEGGMEAALTNDFRITTRAVKIAIKDVQSRLSEAGFSSEEYNKAITGIFKAFVDSSAAAIENKSFTGYRNALIHLHFNLTHYTWGQEKLCA